MASLLPGATSVTLSPLTAHGLPGQVVPDTPCQPPQLCPGQGLRGPQSSPGGSQRVWGQGWLQLLQAVPHQCPQLPREPHGPAPQQELLQQC